jgi:hypothetical protein
MKALERAVRTGIQNLGNIQAAREMLASGQVDEIMKEIEGQGGKALVRGLLGDICMELKTGDENIHHCKLQSVLNRIPEPVPSPFTLIIEAPVDVMKTTDLSDESLHAEIWASFDGQDDADFEKEDLDRMVKKLFKTRFPKFHAVGKVQFYADLPRHTMLPSMNGSSLGAFEWKDEPKNLYNLIKHVSDWDGTLRSHKAMYALNRFHPISAGQIARIWIEERNHPLKNVEDVQFPMFLENADLVRFVGENISQDDAQWLNWYVTRWDLTDSVADMWKLSPELQAAYPTEDEWYQGVNIGMGWQDLLRGVRTVLERAGW